MDSNDISVLLPTYSGDSAPELEAALTSIANQSVSPSEIIVVKERPYPDELNDVLMRVEGGTDIRFVFKLVSAASGLGRALQVGLEECNSGYVARMDADDVSIPDRLKLQCEFFRQNPQVDVVGGYITEYSNDFNEEIGLRKVPTSHSEICKTARRRCPMNHSTVMFRREAVLSVGGYTPSDPVEDYDLWYRMLNSGYTFANLPRELVNSRGGRELYKRRGGVRYAAAEVDLQVRMADAGFISKTTALSNIMIRIPLRLIPTRIRALVYRRKLRK